MPQAAGCRILAIMGSGETSPTMVTVHRALVARLEADRPRAVLLETPYRFQENASDISARAKAYFARSVGLDVTVQAGMRPPAAGRDGGVGDDGSAGVLRSADWVFAGPGSPTYALAEWRDSPVAGALRDRVQAGLGVTVLASAAAVTIGIAALPVYEIYKVGTAPHWLDGLDLLGVLGLKVAVIPHYDNAEGGNHDTRYCYLGERRLSLLERELPGDAAVLGVDEHTAAVIDLRTETVEISGRGGLTVRRRGASTVLPAGTVVALGRLRDLVSRGTPPAAASQASRPQCPGTLPRRPGPQTRRRIRRCHCPTSSRPLSAASRRPNAIVMPTGWWRRSSTWTPRFTPGPGTPRRTRGPSRPGRYCAAWSPGWATPRGTAWRTRATGSGRRSTPCSRCALRCAARAVTRQRTRSAMRSLRPACSCGTMRTARNGSWTRPAGPLPKPALRTRYLDPLPGQVRHESRFT